MLLGCRHASAHCPPSICQPPARSFRLCLRVHAPRTAPAREKWGVYACRHRHVECVAQLRPRFAAASLFAALQSAPSTTTSSSMVSGSSSLKAEAPGEA